MYRIPCLNKVEEITAKTENNKEENKEERSWTQQKAGS